MSNLFAVPAPTTFLPRRSIGPFTLFLTVEEVAHDELEITEHPVQRGAAITDHAFRKPARVTVRALFGPQSGPLSDVYRQILALQGDDQGPPQIFDVVTGKRVYRNMMLKALDQVTDNLTERVLAVTAELQEVRLVSVETVTVPERSRQADPSTTGAIEEAGKKQATEAGGGQSRSALKALSSALGG